MGHLAGPVRRTGGGLARGGLAGPGRAQQKAQHQAENEAGKGESHGRPESTEDFHGLPFV